MDILKANQEWKAANFGMTFGEDALQEILDNPGPSCFSLNDKRSKQKLKLRIREHELKERVNRFDSKINEFQS